MRTLIYDTDKRNPRIVIELSADIDLLVACIKDGELEPGQVAKTLNDGMAKIIAALHKGVAKKDAQAKEK